MSDPLIESQRVCGDSERSTLTVGTESPRGLGDAAAADDTVRIINRLVWDLVWRLRVGVVGVAPAGERDVKHGLGAVTGAGGRGSRP